MSTSLDNVNHFFSSMHNESNITGSSELVPMLEQSIITFIESETKTNAYDVYRSYFDIYCSFVSEENMVMLDLLDVMKAFEENASTLTERQRDHFVHSVNVFILGLCVFTSNKNYNDAFTRTCKSKTFSNMHEEFLYTWGISALLHDVGYPIEISTNQVNTFSKLILKVDNSYSGVKESFNLNNFEKYITINASSWEANIKEINSLIEVHSEIDVFNSLDLLAFKLQKTLSVDFIVIRDVLYKFEKKMKDEGFVDHGFFSALIVMKWMGYFLNKMEKANLFYNEIITSASAILLHNFYRNVFKKEPFNLAPLTADMHPLGYLLILCDELQDWNRVSYGKLDKNKIMPDNSHIYISNSKMRINYRTTSARISQSFSENKMTLLNSLIDIKGIFIGGLDIICTCDMSGDAFLDEIINDESSLIPRPIVDNILKMAKQIHKKYNAERLKEKPNTPLEYPSWDDLPQDLKYSNLRQARDIPEKLDKIGYYIGPKDVKLTPIKSLTKNEVNFLAKLEHEKWVEERVSNGWIYGEKKDVINKISPYIANWGDILTEIKEYDVQVVRSMLPLLESIGMKVYKKSITEENK